MPSQRFTHVEMPVVTLRVAQHFFERPTLSVNCPMSSEACS
jgi:hypothetical protein